MTPAQRKQAASLIRQECCCCEDGNCIVLDDGDTCTCPQTVSFSVCCKWFRWAVLPLDLSLIHIYLIQQLLVVQVAGDGAHLLDVALGGVEVAVGGDGEDLAGMTLGQDLLHDLQMCIRDSPKPLSCRSHQYCLQGRGHG